MLHLIHLLLVYFIWSFPIFFYFIWSFPIFFDFIWSFPIFVLETSGKEYHWTWFFLWIKKKKRKEKLLYTMKDLFKLFSFLYYLALVLLSLFF